MLFRLLKIGLPVSLLITFLISTGCKKVQEAKTEDILEQYFEQNVLNRDFRVFFASDTGVVITPEYDGYIFRLTKDSTNSNTEGRMTGVKNSITTSGRWACTENFGKLYINLTQPTTPPAFIFLNRNWKFTQKAFPVMKLAPWGTDNPLVLHMERL